MTREYPAHPLVGVGVVIVDDEERVVLVKRRQPPLAGQWSLPGGLVEVGETMAESAAREAQEETGLRVEVGPVIEVFDRIIRDAAGRVQYHYVLVDFLCRPVNGTLGAATDAAEAVWAPVTALAEYGLAPKTQEVILEGRRRRSRG